MDTLDTVHVILTQSSIEDMELPLPPTAFAADETDAHHIIDDDETKMDMTERGLAQAHITDGENGGAVIRADTAKEDCVIASHTPEDYVTESHASEAGVRHGEMTKPHSTDGKAIDAHRTDCEISETRSTTDEEEEASTTEGRIPDDNIIVTEAEAKETGSMEADSGEVGVTADSITQTTMACNVQTGSHITDSSVREVGETNDGVREAVIVDEDGKENAITSDGVIETDVSDSETAKFCDTDDIGITDDGTPKTLSTDDNVTKAGITNSEITEAGIMNPEASVTECNLTECGVMDSAIREPAFTGDGIAEATIMDAGTTESHNTDSNVTEAGSTDIEIKEVGITGDEITDGDIHNLHGISESDITDGDLSCDVIEGKTSQTVFTEDEMNDTDVRVKPDVNASNTPEITHSESMSPCVETGADDEALRDTGATSEPTNTMENLQDSRPGESVRSFTDLISDTNEQVNDDSEENLTNVGDQSTGNMAEEPIGIVGAKEADLIDARPIVSQNIKEGDTEKCNDQNETDAPDDDKMAEDSVAEEVSDAYTDEELEADLIGRAPVDTLYPIERLTEGDDCFDSQDFCVDVTVEEGKESSSDLNSDLEDGESKPVKMGYQYACVAGEITQDSNQNAESIKNGFGETDGPANYDETDEISAVCITPITPITPIVMEKKLVEASALLAECQETRPEHIPVVMTQSAPPDSIEPSNDYQIDSSDIMSQSVPAMGDNDREMVRAISFVHILEISPHSVPADLDNEYRTVMSQALGAQICTEKTSKAQTLEQAIRTVSLLRINGSIL